MPILVSSHKFVSTIILLLFSSPKKHPTPTNQFQPPRDHCCLLQNWFLVQIWGFFSKIKWKICKTMLVFSKHQTSDQKIIYLNFLNFGVQAQRHMMTHVIQRHTNDVELKMKSINFFFCWSLVWIWIWSLAFGLRRRNQVSHAFFLTLKLLCMTLNL
jgi:hypothetical protein